MVAGRAPPARPPFVQSSTQESTSACCARARSRPSRVGNKRLLPCVPCRQGPALLIFVLSLPPWVPRNALPPDFDSVLHLWDTVGTPRGVSDTPDGLARLLALDLHSLLLCETDDDLVGTLIAAWDGWRASFYRLVVHPSHRRRGIATALLRHGERRLAALGALRLTAIVAEDDPSAFEFWVSAGYLRQANRARFVRHLGPSGSLGGIGTVVPWNGT